MNEPTTSPGFRVRLQQWIESPAIQNWIVILIVLNAGILGLETSETIVAHDPGALKFFEHIILAVFLFEIIVKLIALDVRFFRSSWNIFDFVIVTIALIPATGPLAILRSLRVLRALRLLGKVPRLRRMIESLMRALPSIGWIMLLLAMVFYIFAVLGTQLFGATFPAWFGNLGRTLYTLFQIMTLESWSMGIARPVIEQFPLAWPYFVLFIVITAMTVLNLFIGVIVSTMQEGVHADDMEQREAIEARAQAERSELLREIQQIRRRLDQLDPGGNST